MTGTVATVAVIPGGGTATEDVIVGGLGLAPSANRVKAVDVADDVVAGGRTRPADPPRGVGPRFWLWTSLSLAIVVAVVGFRIWKANRGQARTGVAPGGPAGP